MKLSTQPYKGTRDFYPEDKRIQKYMFGKIRQVVESYGYQEYDASIIESFELFAAKSGEELVNEQLYSFEDRGGRKVAIRPEMTPTVSRMVAARKQELVYPLRWYSIPNMWRYERPQRGRLREFWQLNVDIFGVDNLNADFEVIQVANEIMKAFGAKKKDYVVKINSRKFMSNFFINYIGIAQEDVPALVKLVDRIDKIGLAEFEYKLKDFLPENDQAKKINQLVNFLKGPTWDELPYALTVDESLCEVKALKKMLANSDIPWVFDPSLARGLDYYTDIVFEVFDTDPENNRAMFGGGRYDGLIELFGVEKVPTVGFGMGDVTLQNFLQSHGLLPKLDPETQVIAVLIGDVAEEAQPLLADIRSRGINLAVDISGRKFDAQLKSALKSGVKFVLFIGEDELSNNQFKLKNLETGKEKSVNLNDAVRAILNS